MELGSSPLPHPPMNERQLPLLTPFAERSRPALMPAPAGACGNTNRLARIWMLKGYHVRQVWTALRNGVGPLDLLRTQFPFQLPDGRVPPSLHVEFTNVCNLRCGYCSSPLRVRPRGMMDAETFHALLARIREADLRRILVVGNGEPTLHPEFADYIRALAHATRFVSVTTNWQRVSPPVLAAVLEAPVRLLNVSVDGGDRGEYEASRRGGSFERVLENLRRLLEERDRRGAPTRVNVRVMLRPSHAAREAAILDFWRPYGDHVTRQYVVDWTGTDDDTYAVRCTAGVFPRCTLTFRQLDVRWDGGVPLCTYSHTQSGHPEGVLLGNIRTHSVRELWTHPLIRQYRRGQRRRDGALMPLCGGCTGC